MGRHLDPNKTILTDPDCKELSLTTAENVPVEVVDSNGLNLDLTTESNVPVAVKDANGRDLELTTEDNVPVALKDSNGRDLELTAQSNVPIAIKDVNGSEVELWQDDKNSIPNKPTGDYLKEVVNGNITGESAIFKFGRSENVTTTEGVIWDGLGGAVYEFPTTVETLTIVSTSVNDVAAGTGGRTIIVYGLDTDFNEVFTVETLTGTTPVVTTQTFSRVYRAFILTSGTNSIIGDANDGTITITHTTSTQILALVLPNNGQTLMSQYTVPAGKSLSFTGITLSVGQGKTCTFYVRARNGPTSADAFSIKFSMELYESTFTSVLSIPVVFPEKTDFAVTAATSVGTIAAAVSWDGVLADD